MIAGIDTDGSGTINYTEFLATTLDKSVYLKEEKYKEKIVAKVKHVDVIPYDY